MYKTRMGALVLAMAAMAAWPTVSLAQRHGGGHGGGHPSGGGHADGGHWGGGGWGGSSWDGGHWDGGRNSFYFNYGYPYGLSFGYGRGYYPYYGYYGYSPWWGNSWWGNSDYYSYPSYGYDYGYQYAPSYDMYQSPGYSYESAYPPDYSSGMMSDMATRVAATIRLPSPNATLWIEGQQMSSQGQTRRFVSPALDPNERYTYTFRAEWTDPNGKKVDQTRSLKVYPGDRITVDFNRPEGATPERRGTRQSGYGPEGERTMPPDQQPNVTPNQQQNQTPRSTTTPPPPPAPRQNNPAPDRNNSGGEKSSPDVPH